MTVVLLIYNSNAMVLAGDSRITVDSKKTFDGACKLFELSNELPMGALVYGSSDFMGIPIETLIKEYSKQADFNECNDVISIKNDFIEFIYKKCCDSNYDINFEDYIFSFKSEIESDLSNFYKNEIIDFFNDIDVSDLIEKFDKSEKFNKFDYVFDELVPSFYEDEEKQIIKQKLKTRFLEYLPYVGVVIGGFDKENLFPSFISFNLFMVLNNELIYFINCSEINSSNACVYPFAQNDVICSFLTGIDINTKLNIESNFGYIIDTYLIDFYNFVEESKNFDEDFLFKLKEQMVEFKNLSSDVKMEFNDFIYGIENNSIDKIFFSVSSLPNNELITMAKSLIEITFLKHKVEENLVTTGGDINLAIMTKGDGFKWIK